MGVSAAAPIAYWTQHLRDAIQADFFADRVQVDGPPVRGVVTTAGELLPYVRLASSGEVPEGEAGTWHASVETAVYAWLEAFSEYWCRQPGVCFWRERPYVLMRPEEGTLHYLYTVRSRLIITDKPIVGYTDLQGAANHV